MKPTLYWTQLVYDNWKLYMAATSKGLCYVGSQDKPFEEMEVWVNKHYPGCPLVQDDNNMQPYVAEFKEFFQGVRNSFTIPQELIGTDFQTEVWNALCKIPYGETWTYSDIANAIQRPSAVRAVGTAIGANPVLLTVPCHRVIGKNGKLTGFRGGLDMKEQLLKIEKENLHQVK
ncbi:methylated-DNA--[protein]-cysteine S-methyltransferase [Neobacillus sp. CF12]|uniref:methylated-DNA--[protein]-cysteine S-methyltransferase n=1 Tax=Neobacillus sp. CF12 TaxID=3055864 RepID=UPI0025A2EA69|nr:methylated-DNA--[protein]-cysteine S-methyltransferase [Neobacillus sp. CF12]MDM5326532.1 methylated-DNA--[protein]-cysteine S-methyltransferase [Neobacillus sp. CF12]